MNLLHGLEVVAKPVFKDLLVDEAVTFVIADGAVMFALDVAEEVSIPLVYFDTISPCGLWTYLCVAKLIEAGEIPFKGNDLDSPIKNVPGMETILRACDLPSFCRTNDLNDPVIKLAQKEAKQVPRSPGLILNTFEELDFQVLCHMKTLCPNIYSIGPLHTHLKMKLEAEHKTQISSSSSLWQEDRSCILWLDKQPPKSVVYISIGSLATMTWDQLMEFWFGVVNSGQRFLWIRRPNSVSGQHSIDQIPTELTTATDNRGCIVGWAPQEEVLAHPAVGGFLTHGGWNSTLESIVEGVPMICWPYFMDQQPNSRLVSEVWNVGIDIKDTCDRSIVEKAIKDLMDVRRDKFLGSVNLYKELARKSVGNGGSSCEDFERLVNDIRAMKFGHMNVLS